MMYTAGEKGREGGEEKNEETEEGWTGKGGGILCPFLQKFPRALTAFVRQG